MQYITGHISKKHLWIPSGKCEITKIISNKYRSNNFALPFPSFLSFYWYLLQHFFCHFDMADTPFFGFFCMCLWLSNHQCVKAWLCKSLLANLYSSSSFCYRLYSACGCLWIHFLPRSQALFALSATGFPREGRGETTKLPFIFCSFVLRTLAWESENQEPPGYEVDTFSCSCLIVLMCVFVLEFVPMLKSMSVHYLRVCQ